jgi:hypothetical protein
MLAAPAADRALPKRPAAWAFEKLDTLRHRTILRAGRITRPQGQLTLTMSANEALHKDLLHLLDALQKKLHVQNEEKTPKFLQRWGYRMRYWNTF